MIIKKYIYLLIFTLCLILGAVFGIMFNVFEDKMPITTFEKTLHSKENMAGKNLQIIKNLIIAEKSKTDFVNKIYLENIENQDIFYYVIKDSNLLFWSDNQLDIKSVHFYDLKNNAFVKMSNAFCLIKIDSIQNIKLLAAIKIKNIYGVSNKYVSNDFANGFLLDKSIEIVSSYQQSGAIYNLQGKYIFSLIDTQNVNHNKIFFYLSIFFIFFAFVFYGLIYYNIYEFFSAKTLTIKEFILITAAFYVLPLLSVILQMPPIIFKHRIFNPLLFYSDIMPSLGHLLIITLLVWFSIITLYYKVSFVIKYKYLFFGFFQIFFPLFFLIIMRIIHNIIYNSTLDVFTFPPQNNKIYSVITLSIVVLWFLIFCFAYKKFAENIKNIISDWLVFLTNAICLILLCLILFLFEVPNYLLFSFVYFALITLMFLFIKIIKTSYTFIFLAIICYFISIFVVYYTFENQQNNQFKDAEIVADNLLLQADNIASNYLSKNVINGYPDKIFEDKLNNISQKFSSAIYQNNKLVYESGNFAYPIKYNFKIENTKNSSANYSNYIHYIFVEDNDSTIVVSCEQMSNQNIFIQNLTYIFLILIFFLFLIQFIFKPKDSQENKSITDNLQKSFIYIIALALSIVVLSITYFIYSEYRDVQKRELETKSKYIYADFNNYFRETPHEKAKNISEFTKTLSHKYDIDIQLYNTDGELIAASSPYVFTNGFVSNLINPKFFFDKPQTNKIKVENIGSLKYFSIYNAILNEDKSIVAYLDVPMFFSIEQLRAETILYLSIISNIFFIILIASILLNYWLSSRITLSISKIEKSLKNIAIGGKNLKMEIKQNKKIDEIERLMLQYNILVDELENKTNILLENERNLAWRNMAKQIAHEIKNPLTPMKLSIQQAQRIKVMKPKEFDEYFNKMSPILIEQIDNLSKIASSFANFANIKTENYEKVDITQKLFSTIELFKNNTKNVEINYERPLEPIFVIADREQILTVFNNIFKNAIQAIPNERKGNIDVAATLTSENVLIAISDNGCGITEEDSKNIFIPNFSTKSSGAGLGLSIVKHIIETANGKIWFKSKVDKGTTFFIELKVEK